MFYKEQRLWPIITSKYKSVQLSLITHSMKIDVARWYSYVSTHGVSVRYISGQHAELAPFSIRHMHVNWLHKTSNLQEKFP